MHCAPTRKCKLPGHPAKYATVMDNISLDQNRPSHRIFEEEDLICAFRLTSTRFATIQSHSHYARTYITTHQHTHTQHMILPEAYEILCY